MTRSAIEVPVLSDAIHRLGVPLSLVTRGAGQVFVSGIPPLDIETGEIVAGDIRTQCDAALTALRQCLKAAGCDMADVLSVRLYAANSGFYDAINEVYAVHFAGRYPARTFVPVAGWPGGFDLEIDCIALDPCGGAS